MQNPYKRIFSKKQGKQNMITNGLIYYNFLRYFKKALEFVES